MTNPVVTLSPFAGAGAQFFDSNGVPLAGGFLYTYSAGTTTQQATYTTPVGNVANSNPIVLGSDGRTPQEIWLLNGYSYKFVLQNSSGSQIGSYDNIPSNSSNVAIINDANSVAYEQGTSVTAGNFIVGQSYLITSVGTTNFQSIGATSNTVGIYFIATGVGSGTGTAQISRTVQSKLQETISVKDFGVTGSGTETTAFQAALTALAGSSGNGYQTNPVTLNLNGLTITFTGQIFLPINVSLINGTLTSSSGSVVMRNPYIANTGGPGYTAYWPYMTAVHNQVTFNCLTILNVYINANFYNCSFPVGLVLVNSNSLWTEHNRFIACTFSGNSTNGFGILMDGNKSGNSTYSTGSGAGISDGSFGYNSFEADCEVSVSGSIVGLKLTDGANFYNGNIYFNGYTNGVSPSGALIYIANTSNVSRISYCNFNVHIESSDSGSNYANVISLDANSQFWYNTGFIHSASGQTTFAQGSSVDMRSNNVYVVGVQLQNPNGSTVSNGTSYATIINGSSLLARSYAKPAFSGTLTTAQSFSSNVVTKMSFDATEYDTNNNYSASRFTPTVTGYYQINSNVSFTTSSSVTNTYIAIYKNGSLYKLGTLTKGVQNPNPSVSSIVYLNGNTDYVEIYGYVFDNGQAPATVAGGANTFFNGSFLTTGGL